MGFGGHIKEARCFMYVEQSELSERTGIPQSTLSKYENNVRVPSIANLWKIADVLGVSVDMLIGRETPQYQDMVCRDIQKLSDKQCGLVRVFIKTIQTLDE